MTTPEQSVSTEPHAEEVSEFGAGVVVCLAKFSEHLWNDMYERVCNLVWWEELPEEKREQQRQEARKFPRGDAARRMLTVESFGLFAERSHAENLSRAIEMWMNGASDHFYDLDRERSPDCLVALADLALRIGHGFTDRTWTWDDVKLLRELWRKSCIELDRRLGTEPDWGQW